MTDRGLSRRLRQRSRRAGLMIGLSMALTIAVCAGSFAVIYAALDPFTSDFVTRGDPGGVETPEQLAANPETEPTAAATQQTDVQGPPAPEQTPTPPPPSTPAEDGFNPDYQIRSASTQSINFRSGPTVESAVVRTLYPGAPLEYLDEDAPTTRPQDGARWMHFEDEEGNEGWVREIDVEPYQE